MFTKCLIDSDDEINNNSLIEERKIEEKSISEINTSLKKIVDKMNLVEIIGEIHNLSISNGNMYFLLSDNVSKINCIFWDNNIYKEINLNIGDVITCYGKMELYSKIGKIYLNITKIIKKKHKKSKFSILKESLQKEGFFNNKKKVRKNNYNIGIVTSKRGAAIKDIISVIRGKTKYAHIFVSDTKVQGIGASRSISESILKLDKLNLDVILVSRGGGSDDDLSCFNSKILVKTIYNCKTPIISGIGHEKDITLCDLVADKSCITPSIAAFDCVCQIDNTITYITNIFKNIKDKYYQIKMNYQNIYNRYAYKMKYYSPLGNLKRNIKLMNVYFNNIDENYNTIKKSYLSKIDNLEKINDFNNPENIMKMGYFLLKNKEGYINNIEGIEKYSKILIINRGEKVLIKKEKK